MSSIITGILIVLSIFFLLPWLYFLPKVCSYSANYAYQQAVLAAIVVLVVYASESWRTPWVKYANLQSWLKHHTKCYSSGG